MWTISCSIRSAVCWDILHLCYVTDKEKTPCSKSEKALKSAENFVRERKEAWGNTAGRTAPVAQMSTWLYQRRAGLLLLAGCILYAFLERGKAHGIIGGLAIVSLVLSVNGIRLAVSGFGERDCNYLSCKVGFGQFRGGGRISCNLYRRAERMSMEEYQERHCPGG